MKTKTTRMFAALVMALGTVFAAALMMAGSANAVTTGPPPGGGGVGGVHVCSGNPVEGGSVTLCGKGCAANSTVTATLDTGDVIGSATSGSDGTFKITGTIPSGVTGSHTITVHGTGCSGVAGVNVAAASTGGGTLAGTGVAVVGIGALGAVLLVGGALMLLAGRRRSGSHA